MTAAGRALNNSLDRNTSKSATAIQGCYHCGTQIPQGELWSTHIDNEQRFFCCPACQTVCESIHAMGLAGFYGRVNRLESQSPPPASTEETMWYDLDEVQAEFVPSLDSEREINLLVEGMHCAACVWLIERALGELQGVEQVRVNLTGRRVFVRWDNDQIHLSRIFTRLNEVGYNAVPYDPRQADQQLHKQNRSLLFRMAFAGFAMMNLLWISVALYSGADQSEFRRLFHWVGLLLATPTLLYSGFPFLHGAWLGLRQRYLTMDLPIAIGALVSFGYSLYVTLSDSAVGEVYYDTVVNFLFVILVGRYLESISRRKAVASTERLIDLQPRAASVLSKEGEKVLPIRAVQVGDTVLVKPGERFPVDGEVVAGNSSVDESLLTGESKPVVKSPGNSVSAGTINLDNPIQVQVQKTLSRSALGRIIHLVEQARSCKSASQRLADRVVPWFIAATLLLAGLTFLIWLGHGVETAISAATAVLIITCPCAFGLATPMSIAAAAGVGARNGILIKDGEALETLSQVDHLLFDKTGTLTYAEIDVSALYCAAGVESTDLLASAAGVESQSEHPIARAIVDYARRHQVAPRQTKDISVCAGKGIIGVIDGKTYRAGKLSWLQSQGVITDSLFPQLDDWQERGHGVVHVARETKWLGALILSVHPRAGALETVDWLRKQGMPMTLISGDQTPVVAALAQNLGGMDFKAEVLPAEKQMQVQILQEQGKRVAMLGDGVNDAPALSQADVAITLGSGAHVSADCAQIILMREDLQSLQQAFILARRTLATIRQNIGISVVYNVVMIPMAMAGLVSPLLAALAMPVSSLLVIGNAARLQGLFRRGGNV